MRMITAILLLASLGCGATADRMRTESAVPSSKAKQKDVEPQPGTTAKNERTRKLVLADISLVEAAAAETENPKRLSKRSKLASSFPSEIKGQPSDAIDDAPQPPSGAGGDMGTDRKEAEAISTVSDRAVLDMVRASIVSHLEAIANCFDDQARVDSLVISAGVTEQGGLSNIAVQTPTGGSAATLCTATELRKLRIANYEHGRRKVVLKRKFQPAN